MSLRIIKGLFTALAWIALLVSATYIGKKLGSDVTYALVVLIIAFDFIMWIGDPRHKDK